MTRQEKAIYIAISGKKNILVEKYQKSYNDFYEKNKKEGVDPHLFSKLFEVLWTRINSGKRF